MTIILFLCIYLALSTFIVVSAVVVLIFRRRRTFSARSADSVDVVEGFKSSQKQLTVVDNEIDNATKRDVEAFKQHVMVSKESISAEAEKIGCILAYRSEQVVPRLCQENCFLSDKVSRNGGLMRKHSLQPNIKNLPPFLEKSAHDEMVSDISSDVTGFTETSSSDEDNNVVLSSEEDLDNVNLEYFRKAVFYKAATGDTKEPDLVLPDNANVTNGNN